MPMEDGASIRVSFGDFVLDRADERLIGPAGPIRVGHKAYRVLDHLIRNDGRLVTKEVLFSTIWDGTIVSESALTSAIKELRRALGDETRAPRYIESVYGRGYRFLAAAAAAHDEPSGEAVRREASSALASATARDARPPLILVALFDDKSVRERDPHCAEELREEVLSGLARFREIQLVAEDSGILTSALPNGGRGYRLGAKLLPDRLGVKVIARATRLSDGVVVWAETMPLGGDGTVGGVERIVRRIVGAALPAVDHDVSLGLPADGGNFYDDYLAAKRRSYHPTGFEDAREAADALESIIAARPEFALAYPPLVRLYNTDFGYTGLGSSSLADRDRALGLAKTALARDRDNVHAYTVLAFCYLWHEEWELARSYFEQAVELNPFNATRLKEVAAGMVYLAEFERARALFAESLHLQPRTDDLHHEDLAQLALFEGDLAAVRRLLKPMSERRVWASLYRALADQDEDPGKLVAWRDWVGARWVAGAAPDQEALERWIAFHHPLVPALKAKFTDLVRGAFAAAGVATAEPHIPQQAHL